MRPLTPNVLFMKIEMKKSIIFCVLIFVAIGCSPSSMGVKLTEINRYTSPDSRVDAVIVTSDAGATTSIGHHIFIVPKGESPEDLKFSILTADHVVGLVPFLHLFFKLPAETGTHINFDTLFSF